VRGEDGEQGEGEKMGMWGKNKGKGRERMGREGVREGGERPYSHFLV